MRYCSKGEGLLKLPRSKFSSADRCVCLNFEPFSPRGIRFARGVRGKMSSEFSSSEKLVLYPPKSPLISVFWREKYEKDAGKYWDLFYKRNTNKFFKDRHYLDKEWGKYFHGMGLDADLTVSDTGLADSSHQRKTILEVGCGTGNTVYPLISQYPEIYVYACDFSRRAVDLVKAHADYNENRVKAFICDVTKDRLSDEIPQQSVHVVTLVFVLSAIAPEKMPTVLSNVKSIMKPGGYILLRDYAVGDLAQERLTIKDQKISENFYVRGDGTRAYYFSEDVLAALFAEQGFECKELKTYCRQLENRSRKIVMDRRWIQAVFHLPKLARDPKLDFVPVSEGSKEDLSKHVNSSCGDLELRQNEMETSKDLISEGIVEKTVERINSASDSQIELGVIDFSALELFGGAPAPEPLDVTIGNFTVHAMCLPRENQHTFASTGFMLWESASAFAELLAANPAITIGKTVLELGCGSVGLCSLISSLHAKRVVATDGDAGTLRLLQDNLQLNRASFPVDVISCDKLEWGNKSQADAVRETNNSSGFQLIIGTDVTYMQEAVPLLFDTAAELLTGARGTDGYDPLFLLCYRVRRVAVSDILSAASARGFSVAGLWTTDAPAADTLTVQDRIHRSEVESLFRQGLEKFSSSYPGLQILCLRPAHKT